jgi:two-component system, chemotaxis family, protein-glutamate methylesterase/glutaminase
MKDTIRVLVVDDSTVVRMILVNMLQSVPGFDVVGEALDGIEAVEMTALLRPDVVTMDIRMPRMNGIEATRQIMRTTPTPIVVVATSIHEADLNIAFAAIEAGALTVVEKPKGLSPEDFLPVRDQLITTVRLMSDVQVVTLWGGGRREVHPSAPAGATGRAITRPGVIVMGASTGGPGILHEILRELPADFSIPIALVQHITSGFGQGFAQWLNSVTALQVRIAREGDRLQPGSVLIAPDDAHLQLMKGGYIHLDGSPPVSARRPSVTCLFESAARSFGAASLGIILTGMGDDGVDGLAMLRRYGGRVIAQNEESCIVFGMPKVAIDRGVVDQVMEPREISSLLRSLDGHIS